MKKNIFFTALLLCAATIAQAQFMRVTSMQPLQVNHDGETVLQAVAVSPQGDYILLSSDTKRGLIKWDLSTGTAATVTTDEGAGADVRISPDGQQIVYGEVTYKDRRRHQAVKAVDLQSGKKQTLVKATRHLQGFAVEDGKAATVTTDGTIQTHTLRKGSSRIMDRPVLSRHHLKLYITQGGKTTMLAPNGEDERYIWGSLSPDGSRVLYYVSGRGAFVCNIDGGDVIAMGDITAPKWWDDNTIVGMLETYDGDNVASASIVARTLDGEKLVLTGSDVIATYPIPSAAAGIIAFSTPDGKIYILNVETPNPASPQ